MALEPVLIRRPRARGRPIIAAGVVELREEAAQRRGRTLGRPSRRCLALTSLVIARAAQPLPNDASGLGCRLSGSLARRRTRIGSISSLGSRLGRRLGRFELCEFASRRREVLALARVLELGVCAVGGVDVLLLRADAVVRLGVRLPAVGREGQRRWRRASGVVRVRSRDLHACMHAIACNCMHAGVT